jgi:hypothetical protein
MRFKFLILLLVIGSSLAEAQSFYAIRRNRDLMLNLGIGTTNYFGDFVNPKSFGLLKPSVVIGAEHFISNRIALRTEFAWFQIGGTDTRATTDRDERNLSFKANNFELSTVGIVNLTPMGTRFYQRSQLNFYGFAGIALLYMNPKAEFNGKTYALQPLETEGVSYSRFQPVIPFGFGAKIKYGPFFNILLEGGYRLTFTDYMDDVSSRNYADPATLKSDLTRSLADRRVEGYVNRGQDVPRTYNKPPEELYKVGKRGNPDKKDGYFMMNVKVQYYLPYTLFEEGSRKLYNRKRRAIYRRR